MEKLIWPGTILAFCVFFVLLFRREIGKFIKEVVWFKTKWFELKRIREEVFAKAEEVKRLSTELNRDKKELREATKVFVESFYLTLQTKNVFPIPKPIAKEIEKNLNILARFAVEDETKRKNWTTKIQLLLAQSLPK